MNGEIHDIDDLIGKTLTGEATEVEKSRLAQWRAAHPDNERYVAQLTAVFEKATSSKADLEFDTEAAWQKVKGRMHGAPSKRFSILESRPLRIAAGILFLAAAGIALFRQLNPRVETYAIVTEAIVTQDTLPDGSKAVLNKRSSISYEYNPRSKVRKVKLKGESYFEIKHEEQKPFVIEAEEVLIRDIGTAFNVKAWPEKDTVEVVVETGEVKFYTLLDSGIHLKAGETGIFSRRNHAFSRITAADVNVLAYQTGELNFVNTDLKSVVQKINEVYEARIRLENPALETCRLTVSFHHDTLDTIVDVIAETMKLTITRNDKEILLSGKGCN